VVNTTQTKVGIVEWARRTESARTIEMQLAALLGGWVPRITPAGAKLLLARHAHHFAWHAELWDGLVPVLHDRGEESTVTEASLEEAAAALASVSEPRGVYDDVVPHLIAAYRSWSAESTPIAERPIMRVLDLVLRDIDFDAQEGHDLFSRG
jgi:hypothetical protein